MLFGALSSYMRSAPLRVPSTMTDRLIFIQLHIENNMRDTFNYRRRREKRTTKTTTSQRAAQQKNSGYWVHRLKLHITYYVAKYHVFNVRLPSSSSSLALACWRSHSSPPLRSVSTSSRAKERDILWFQRDNLITRRILFVFASSLASPLHSYYIICRVCRGISFHSWKVSKKYMRFHASLSFTSNSSSATKSESDIKFRGENAALCNGGSTGRRRG